MLAVRARNAAFTAKQAAGIWVSLERMIGHELALRTARSCHFGADKKSPIADLRADRPNVHQTQKRDISADASIRDVANDEHISSTTDNPARSASRGAVADAIAQLNSVSSTNPMTVFYLFFASRAVTWGVLTKAFTAVQVCSGPELAIGWLVSRFTSKFRQPANLALAAVLQRLAPVLSDIKVTALIGVITPPPETCTDFVDSLEAKKKAMRAANGGTSAVADGADKAGAMAKVMAEGALAMADRLQGPVDKYGASLFLISKVTGISTIVGVYFAVRHGVDVTAWMEYMGASRMLTDVGAATSCMAAAVVANTFMLPAHLWISVKASPSVGAKAMEWEQRYYHWVKEMEKKGM